MSAALSGFVRCKCAQATPAQVPGKPASAAVSGLVGALIGAGLLGGERLVNGKRDPRTRRDPAARRLEALKRALLGGVIGGVGGAAYGHARQPGGPLSGSPAVQSGPGNAIPAVPATVIGALLGAGALGGGRAITRAKDPAESEDLEEGSGSIWRQALLGAGLGGAAGYGLSWHTRPGGYLSPGADPTVAPAATTKLTESELLAEIGKDRAGPNDALTGAVVGSAGAKLAPSALRVLGGIGDAARTVKVTPDMLLTGFEAQARNGKQLPQAAEQFVNAAAAQRARGGASLDAAELLRVQSRATPTLANDLLEDAKAYRGKGEAPISYSGKLRTALRNVRRDVMPENIPAGKTTQRTHAGRVLPVLSGIVGALWGAGNENTTAAYQKQLDELRSTRQ